MSFVTAAIWFYPVGRSLVIFALRMVPAGSVAGPDLQSRALVKPPPLTTLFFSPSSTSASARSEKGLRRALVAAPLGRAGALPGEPPTSSPASSTIANRFRSRISEPEKALRRRRASPKDCHRVARVVGPRLKKCSSRRMYGGSASARRIAHCARIALFRPGIASLGNTVPDPGGIRPHGVVEAGRAA